MAQVEKHVSLLHAQREYICIKQWSMDAMVPGRAHEILGHRVACKKWCTMK